MNGLMGRLRAGARRLTNRGARVRGSGIIARTVRRAARAAGGRGG
jgi:hypothetical protein